MSGSACGIEPLMKMSTAFAIVSFCDSRKSQACTTPCCPIAHPAVKSCVLYLLETIQYQTQIVAAQKTFLRFGVVYTFSQPFMNR